MTLIQVVIRLHAGLSVLWLYRYCVWLTTEIYPFIWVGKYNDKTVYIQHTHNINYSRRTVAFPWENWKTIWSWLSINFPESYNSAFYRFIIKELDLSDIKIFQTYLFIIMGSLFARWIICVALKKLSKFCIDLAI